MSGVEVVGVVASTLHIAACVSSIIVLVMDVRDELRRGPVKIREHADYLTSLASVLRSLEENPLLQKPEIRLTLGILEEKIRLLQATVHRYLRSSAKGSFRKVCIAIGGVQVQERIASSVDALHREKSTLLLYISARSSEEVHRLFDSYMSDSNKLKKKMQGVKPKVKEGQNASQTTIDLSITRRDSALGHTEAPDPKMKSNLTVPQTEDERALSVEHSRSSFDGPSHRDHPPPRSPQRPTQDDQARFKPQQVCGHTFRGRITYGPESNVRYGDTHEFPAEWGGLQPPVARGASHNFNFDFTNAPTNSEYGNKFSHILSREPAQDKRRE